MFLFSSNRYTLVKTTEHWEEQLSASTLLGELTFLVPTQGLVAVQCL